MPEFDLSDVDCDEVRLALARATAQRALARTARAFADGWRACADHHALEDTITDGIPIEVLR